MPIANDERCPQCNSANVLPLAYGIPSASGIEAARRGEVMLGAGPMYDDCPNRGCGTCRHRWLETSDPGYIEAKALRESLRERIRARDQQNKT